jgi:hypothetical protein
MQSASARAALMAVAALFVSLGHVGGARSETWTCIVPAGKQEGRMISLAVGDSEIVQNGVFHYRILTNNEVGLVAAAGMSLLDLETESQPVISGMLVLIEKRTGTLQWISAENNADLEPAKGHCVEDQ